MSTCRPHLRQGLFSRSESRRGLPVWQTLLKLTCRPHLRQELFPAVKTDKDCRCSKRCRSLLASHRCRSGASCLENEVLAYRTRSLCKSMATCSGSMHTCTQRLGILWPLADTSVPPKRHFAMDSNNLSPFLIPSPAHFISVAHQLSSLTRALEILHLFQKYLPSQREEDQFGLFIQTWPSKWHSKTFYRSSCLVDLPYCGNSFFSWYHILRL